MMTNISVYSTLNKDTIFQIKLQMNYKNYAVLIKNMLPAISINFLAGPRDSTIFQSNYGRCYESKIN